MSELSDGHGLPDLDLDMPMDDGIAGAVLLLRKGGVETVESCEGGAGHAFPEPTVRFAGNIGAGFRAFSIAADYGLPVQAIRRVWDVVDGTPSGPWWEMTFRTKVPRDERLG